MKIYVHFLSLIVACAVLSNIATATQWVPVNVTFHAETNPSTDYPGFTDEHKTALEDKIGQTADQTGFSPDCINVELTPRNDRNPASTKCVPDGSGGLMEPTVDKALLRMNLTALGALFGENGSDSWDDLFDDGDPNATPPEPPSLTPAGEAAVAAATYHELVHVCLELGGGGCNTPFGPTAGKYLCEEAAADKYARDKLCEEVDQKCAELCALEAAADDPPTQEQQEEIDEKMAEVDALCATVKKLRDKWNNEDAAETLCLVAAMDPGCGHVDDSNGDCEEVSVPANPPNPPNPDGSFGDGMHGDGEFPFADEHPECDYPSSPPADKPNVIDNCEKCTEEGASDCDCDEEGEEPLEPPGGSLPVPGFGQTAGGTFYSPSFQLQLIHESLLFAKTGTVHVHFREKDPIVNEWVLSTQSFPLGYKPIFAAPRDSHDHYVLGYSDRSNTWVLERLRVGLTPGSMTATRKPAKTIGDDFVTPLTDFNIVGDEGFIHPDNRKYVRAPREVLWSNSTDQLQDPTKWAVDPDGRFVIIYDQQLDALIRIAPREAVPYEVLYDSTDIQDLHAIDRISICDSSTYGRMMTLCFSANAAQEIIVLSDQSNDGHFETIMPMSVATYKDSSVAGTIYRNFWSWGQ